MSARSWDGTRAMVLGAVGGYVDTVGYVMLHGLFPNHVTGNLPIAAAHPGWQAGPLVLMVPLWLVAVIGAARVARRVEPASLSVLLAMEAVLLLAFLLLGVVLVPGRHAPTFVTQALVGTAGVCAMGVQSVVTRLGGYTYPTTMITGTLTLLGMDIADSSSPAVRRRIAAFSRVVLAFAVGAALGGVVTAGLRFWAIALPLAGVVYCAGREGRAMTVTADGRAPSRDGHA